MKKLLPDTKTIGVIYNTSETNSVVQVDELKSAAESCGETYTGKATHGLRHNFAQEHYQDFLSQGHTPRQALLETAELMGHHRPDITEHYLR